MGLYNDLSHFDGKSVAVLEAIKAGTEAGPDLFDLLVVATGDEDKQMQTGAAWLLRAYLQDGGELSPEQVGSLAANLLDMHDGFGRLHICQAMDHITVPEEQAEAFADFFRSSQATKNTFLLAWAPHGFFRLALQHERYLDEARSMVESALTHSAPSVRARARKTLEGA